ncbi:MAG: hypothetical protein IJ795_07100 [Bacteroidales bacterium]|nr:hypothetical protein [Bacteroidales bacterium]
MKKTIYTAPDAEQITVRFEENILLSGKAAAKALGNSNVDETEEYSGTVSW